MLVTDTCMPCMHHSCDGGVEVCFAMSEQRDQMQLTPFVRRKCPPTGPSPRRAVPGPMR